MNDKDPYSIEALYGLASSSSSAAAAESASSSKSSVASASSASSVAEPTPPKADDFRTVFSRLNCSMTADEQARQNEAFSLRANGALCGDEADQQRADEIEAEIAKSLAFRLAEQALALAKEGADRREFVDDLADAAEWLLDRAKDGFADDEREEFLAALPRRNIN